MDWKENIFNYEKGFFFLNIITIIIFLVIRYKNDSKWAIGSDYWFVAERPGS